MPFNKVLRKPQPRKEVKHGICVISVNLLNQQIYWAVFAVYVALTAWTALSIVGHVLLKFFPELRSALIWTQMPRVSTK